MVIISAVVCEKSGQMLLARQFQNISGLVLKEYVRNFPKMIQPNQQHTFVDYENTRFLYAPLDQLYLLLLTTKNSNIIEDLEALRILNRVISEICVSISPENVKANTFEILLAIDDVIASGIRESTSVAQVRAALDMESSEEKLHIMLMKARENEAKEIAKKHQLEIERKRQEELAKKAKQPKSPVPSNNAFAPPPPEIVAEKPPSRVEETITQQFSSASAVKPNINVNKAPKKGMQLGKKKPAQENLFEQE